MLCNSLLQAAFKNPSIQFVVCRQQTVQTALLPAGLQTVHICRSWSETYFSMMAYLYSDIIGQNRGFIFYCVRWRSWFVAKKRNIVLFCKFYFFKYIRSMATFFVFYYTGFERKCCCSQKTNSSTCIINLSKTLIWHLPHKRKTFQGPLLILRLWPPSTEN